MSDKPDIITNEVAIIKGDTPQECVLKGIDMLGGISTFIEEGDNVFIKFNLNLPLGFPTNTNFDILASIISLCKTAGANKISIGSFPVSGIPITTISSLLQLEDYFKGLGAELAFLDNSNLFIKKDIKKEQLDEIRNESFSVIKINNEDILVPKVVVESNKVISVNQVNVNPLFKLNLSLLNSLSFVSPKFQAVSLKENNRNEILSTDLYKSKLISKIIDIYSIKKPQLVINDLYYILEGAGPYIFKDSVLKKTNIMIIGNEVFAVDLITLKILNIEASNKGLLTELHKRGLDGPELGNIKLLGEKLEETKIEIEFCDEDLEQPNIKNIKIKTGKMCSGCFESAYYLLNFIKTNMPKDLKYNPGNVFLIGENPSNPVNFDNILVFGDCAISTTKSSDFRKLTKHSEKSILGDTKRKILKKPATDKKPKVKVKTNQRILELPGCPPHFCNSLDLVRHYYGKSNTPNLNFLIKTCKLWSNSKTLDKLKAMGVI